MESRTLRVLLFEEHHKGWIAQCLEVDIAAQGSSMKEAMRNFQEVFATQVAFDLSKGREPLAGKKQAPPWYWQALEEAEPLQNPIVLKLPRRSWLSFLKIPTTPAQAWVR
ncbi:MAG: hypothetical protein WCD12_05510 [Candidatus Binatus sp.]|uniref:hypothetical protein n=1 Tax=Candidatus Binatus sp. TaxID=2811406 RepID=UPI003C7411FC